MADKYLVTLNIVVNDKKIEAIKEIRNSLGLGLAESKRLVEQRLPHYVDSFGGDLLCNADQVARLVALDHTCRNRSGLMHPTYTMTRCQRLDADHPLDISNIILQ